MLESVLKPPPPGPPVAFDPDGADWNDKSDAPHEVAAAYRMYKNGWPVKAIAAELKLTPEKLMESLNKAISEESDAEHDGRPIHVEGIDPDWKVE